MPFQKGRQKTGGRKKGTPNQTTALLKDAILEAARRAGAETPDDPDGIAKYLHVQSKANPGPFMALLGKVLPMQVAGPDDAEGNPTGLEIRFVKPEK